MKRAYTRPVFFAGNGTITLTVSQMAALGIGGVSGWDEFWADAQDFCKDENFNVNDPSTWPEGFNLGDSSTWEILLFGGE